MELLKKGVGGAQHGNPSGFRYPHLALVLNMAGQPSGQRARGRALRILQGGKAQGSVHHILGNGQGKAAGIRSLQDRTILQNHLPHPASRQLGDIKHKREAGYLGKLVRAGFRVQLLVLSQPGVGNRLLQHLKQRLGLYGDHPDRLILPEHSLDVAGGDCASGQALNQQPAADDGELGSGTRPEAVRHIAAQGGFLQPGPVRPGSDIGGHGPFAGAQHGAGGPRGGEQQEDAQQPALQCAQGLHRRSLQTGESGRASGPAK